MGKAEDVVLKGTSAGARVRQVQAGFAEVMTMIEKHTPLIAEAFPFFNGPSLGSSYTGSLVMAGERTMEEQAEAAHRALTPANIRWAMGAVSTSARMVASGYAALPQVPCLVPVLSMFHHSPAVRSTLTAHSQKIKLTHAGPDLQPKGSPEDAARPGKEVFINFMPRLWNADLLSMFGVVSTSDVHSVLHVHSASPPADDSDVRRAVDRSVMLMKHLGLSNGLLISPLGLSTTALNVARVRALTDEDFTVHGLRVIARLNNFRKPSKTYSPPANKLRLNASFAAAEMAWVMGVHPKDRAELEAGTEREPVVEGTEATDEPERQLNPHVGGIKLHVKAEFRAIDGLKTALLSLRNTVFGNTTVDEQRDVLRDFKLTKRAAWQRPESDPLHDPAETPATIPTNPTSGPWLLREALRARLEELRAIDAAIADASERLDATRAGSAISGGTGWSKELIDATVRAQPADRRAETDTLTQPEMPGALEVHADGSTGSPIPDPVQTPMASSGA